MPSPKAISITGIIVVFGLIFLVIKIREMKSESGVPPPLETMNCENVAPPNELPNDRFARMGGRIIRNQRVRTMGSAFTIDNIEEGRDIRFYDRLELVGLDPFEASKRHDLTLPTARSFLWSHWQGRKRAYLILTQTSVDARSTLHIFVEPDQFGRWRVYSRTVSPEGGLAQAPTDYSMTWVVQTDWDKPGIALKNGQQPDPARNRLEFRDICGEWDGDF